MNKLKIAVDLHGVIWEIMGVFTDIYNRLYKENVKPEDVDQWNFFPEDRWEVVYPLVLPRIMEYPIIDKDISSHLFILNRSYNINILTKEQNPIGTIIEKLRTIDITEGREYNSIRRLDIDDKKVNYYADVYIDDCPNMINDMLDYPTRVLLLYDRPWNKNYKIKSNNVIRVYDWKDIFNFVNRIRLTKEADKDAVFC